MLHSWIRNYKVYIICAVAAILLLVSVPSVSQFKIPNSSRNNMDQFLLFGDSITQQAFSRDRGDSFGPALTDAYIRRLDIVNRGLSGYNTRQALHVLPSIVPKPEHARVRFMTIFFGANDARLPNTPGEPQQHIPLEEYRRNVKAIATHPAVQAHAGIRLILITPPPIDERKSLAHAREWDPKASGHSRTAAVTAQYAQAVRELGAELKLPVIDVWTAMISRAGGSIDDEEIVGSMAAEPSVILQGLLSDGLHLSMAGYRVLYTELTSLIAKKWPDQKSDKLPFVLPAWSDEAAWAGVNARFS